MSEQLTVAVISGSVAVVVALIGIAGAIVAQLMTSRRAHQNALALFEKQTDEQTRARLEEATRQDRHRFATDRRTTYSKLMRTAADLITARDEQRRFEQTLKKLRRTQGATTPQPEEVDLWRTRATATQARSRDLRTELDQVLAEIELIAGEPVRTAAAALGDQARTADHIEAESYLTARTDFLTAARNELGITQI